MSHDTRYLEAKRITIVGAIVNALLGCSKLIGGFFFHSHALVADGVHSFADLLTDLLVLIASKYGSLEADESHPYGHRRIETAATLFLSIVLIAAGLGISVDACMEVWNNTHTRPMTAALLIAVASIIANELLYYFTKKVGERISSQLIIANAWHHRADSASSAVVVVGLAGSLLGFLYSDAIAAIVVSALVIKIGVEYAWQSIQELVDSAVDEETREKICQIITAIDGVIKIHQLRSRQMAGDIYIDVHILVDPFCTVSEGHYIAQNVHRKLMHEMPKVQDVTVHVDPEDDEATCPSYHLANRTRLQSTYFEQWQRECPELQSVKIHYLDGKIHLELYCQPSKDGYAKLCNLIHNSQIEQEEVRHLQILTLAKEPFTDNAANPR